MNGSARIVGPRKQRKQATFVVAPVTRAIRAALFASTTAFALTAPVVGFAANPCSAERASTQACAEGFRQAAIAQAQQFAPTVDLTVVAGDVPASVHPALAASTGETASIALAGSDFGIGDVVAADTASVDDLTLVSATLDIEQGTDIHLSGTGDVIALDLYDGTSVNLRNLANITAEAFADVYGNAIATGVRLNSVDTDAYNDGSISATATADGGYARARAVDAFGYAVGTTVHNDGDIQASAQADGGTAHSAGIYSFGYASSSTVDNAGDVHASAQALDGRAYATAINSIGYGLDASVTNSGNVSAYANSDYSYAFGVLNFATRQTGSASVTNDGTIEADAIGGFATATGTLNAAYRYGNATTANTGSIDAMADGAYASANGIWNYAYVMDATVDNTGAIVTTAIASTGAALSTAIYNEAVGHASVHHAGTIDATATSTGFADATGVISKSGQLSDVIIDATGDIDVIASSQDGYALAVGAYAIGGSVTTMDNQGAISAHSSSVNGTATAYAAVVNGGYAGIGLMINGGDINAEASAAGDAHATGGFVYADVATIFNDGSTTAIASTVDGKSSAMGLGIYGGYSAIFNYGDLAAAATASGDAGTAESVGSYVFGYTGGSFDNSGTVTSAATASDIAGTADATGSLLIGNFLHAYSTNTGSISAEASGYHATANGLVNAAVYIGDAITINSGDISATANGVYSAMAVGVYNFGFVYASAIDNSGSIQATADTSYYKAIAIGAQAVNIYGYGDTSVTNSGSISASASATDVYGFGMALSWGAVSQGGHGAGSGITNDGSISSYSYGSADTNVVIANGAYITGTGGISTLVNHGDIDGTSRVGANRGYAYAYGAVVENAYYGSEAIIANYGTISTTVSSYAGITGGTALRAYGYHATVTNAAGAHITATAYTEKFGAAGALGVDAGAKYGVSIVNDGDITAYAHSLSGYYNAATGGRHISTASAVGIYSAGGSMFMEGDTAVVNNGNVTAIALAENGIDFWSTGAGAAGVRLFASGDASITNAGDVFVSGNASLGVASAYGMVAQGKRDSTIVNAAGATVVATATVGSLATDADGGRAFAVGAEIIGSQHGVAYNAGSIVAQAIVTPDGGANPGRSLANAYGMEVRTFATGLATNVGDIQVYASADYGYASAYGIRAPGNPLSSYSNSYEVTVDNAGAITVAADADHGNAFAVGAYAYALRSEYLGCLPYGGGCFYETVGGDAQLHNTGQLHVTADAVGGVAYAYGAVSLGAFTAGVTNAGHITAVVEADDASATGSLANSFYGDALLQNSGVIGASATGTTANAIGVSVMGSYGNVDNGYLAAIVGNQGDIVATATGSGATAIGVEAVGRYSDGIGIDNAGTIAAVANGADGTATAISMTSAGTHALTNTGSIGAFGDGTRIAIASSGGASASLVNEGTLTGAILTGDLDDQLDNGADAFWHAVGESSFGGGDDHIVNQGTLFMDDAVIRLGGYVGGNTFDNTGTLAVSGAANMIDMDNPFPVNNNGTITFLDGAPDDVLTIVGDFAGDGALNVDVSALHQASDRLYVDGNVASTTAQTINVNLLDVAPAARMEVPVVIVNGGAATAGNFVLGDVAYRGNGFVSMQFGLQSRIAAADAEFFLGVDVTGLNDMGSVAAALAPGAQRLVDAQIGTWRQRMGVVPAPSESGLAPWVRGFTDSGDVDTDNDGNFGPGGDFDFDQSNHGWEIGLDARPTDHVAVGMLFADTSGSQHLKAGSGSTRLDGKTFGLYATWFADGFYLDVSQRWSGFDARLQAATGTHTTDVSASAFNVEAGYTGWSVADYRIVPQAQYTRTRIADISPMDNGVSTFVADGGMSIRGRLGVALDTTFQRGAITWTPYGSLNAVHEFKGEYDYAVDGGLFGTTRTDGTSAMVELGVGMRTGKWSVTGGVNWIDGGALEGIGGGQVTMRYNW